jgi:plastocyanin
MRKSWIIGGIVAVIVVIGLIVWAVMGANSSTNTSSTTTTTPSTTDTTDTTGDTNTPIVARETVTVTMKNSQFSPKTLTVKRGTTVKWVNEDTVRHNVVAANENDKSGLPSDNALFGKGGTYEFTFETIGTFEYKCTPHPFMTGTIEVTE